ncbi:hypothetical protein KMW28_05915 [Flammeovirga yaeyamensis]|uniref:Transcriptional regulator n=1 Tax=Flammeovirga yaeyamensis TaxID=367791 RepID=A0AAX1N696_9BACT|nr:hypothetical protein [Flammeovirga yaeyamensis]MBB3697703.1 hypothetical protein [Flammeovirga yaeyamensis]NMF35937.1 hypothetical protein [Flammeovirga yaeyamensis]QWG03114.1 hypothetical protein KMW28_05915 [Flammeovirga yaeyamensis]
MVTHLTPIKSKSQYDAYINRLDDLMELESLSKDQETQLEHLSILIDVYEQENHSVDLSSLTPIDIKNLEWINYI